MDPSSWSPGHHTTWSPCSEVVQPVGLLLLLTPPPQSKRAGLVRPFFLFGGVDWHVYQNTHAHRVHVSVRVCQVPPMSIRGSLGADDPSRRGPQLAPGHARRSWAKGRNLVGTNTKAGRRRFPCRGETETTDPSGEGTGETCGVRGGGRSWPERSGPPPQPFER